MPCKNHTSLSGEPTHHGNNLAWEAPSSPWLIVLRAVTAEHDDSRRFEALPRWESSGQNVVGGHWPEPHLSGLP